MVWRFDAETPIDEQAENLAEHAVHYGEAWMQERTPHEAIIEVVPTDQRGSMPVHPERLPVALWLAGRPDEAREALDAELRKAAGRTDAAAANFRRFADRFRTEVLSSR
jgi:alkanesulfonate monooxygenase SsuD/methylene tetrahydromethanopterin reductase-like flavin-dependent oxidoreductase (luciferase family)